MVHFLFLADIYLCFNFIIFNNWIYSCILIHILFCLFFKHQSAHVQKVFNVENNIAYYPGVFQLLIFGTIYKASVAGWQIYEMSIWNKQRERNKIYLSSKTELIWKWSTFRQEDKESWIGAYKQSHYECMCSNCLNIKASNSARTQESIFVNLFARA